MHLTISRQEQRKINQKGESMSIKHLSIRVPWHTEKWNGKICKNSIDNSFCRILPKINETKGYKFNCELYEGKEISNEFSA